MFSNICAVVLGEALWDNWPLYPNARVSSSMHAPWNVHQNDHHHHEGPMGTACRTDGPLIIILSKILTIIGFIVVRDIVTLWGRCHVLHSTMAILWWACHCGQSSWTCRQAPDLIVGITKSPWALPICWACQPARDTPPGSAPPAVQQPSIECIV